MGLVLNAACSSCDYREDALRLGTTHEAIALHDVEVYELYPAPCCGRVQSVAVLLGMPLPTPPCGTCDQPLALETAQRYAIARLSGEVLQGHPCPACGERTLDFREVERFT